MVDNIPAGVHSSQLPRGRDENFREVYSNITQTQMSPFDITLTFQKGAEVAPGQMAIIDKMAVIMSPQQFKAFVRSLDETLIAYETAFGKLTISDVDTAPLRSSADIIAQVAAAREAAKPTLSSSNVPRPRAKRSRAAAQE